FVMRFNGYIRHSAWSDELYSAIRAASPAQPFINTFNDAGNPPFYFILLRIWFMIFGWTEGAGTMLSVLIGTFSVLTAYLLVKPYFGKKTALFTALFIAFSGFSIGYSQEMRSYILQTALVPLVSAALFGFIKKPSVRNLILYILPSIALANSHFYGVIFIIANFVFYIALTAFRHQWQWKNVCLFFTGNVIVAGSFLPYFMYSIILRGTKFNRNISLEIGHILV
ncbi:MAG: glycosyltransferase family 39 protein, partial [Treponema sp.]|nr:glycosyltransferase family 39 protein [Treponema sp.]